MFDLIGGYLGQLLAVFVVTFFLFFILIEVKFFALRLQKKGGAYKVVGYILFYSMAVLFIPADILLNIYLSPVYRQRPNKFGEGWLVTDRVKHHKRYTDKRRFNYKASIFICDKFIEKVDPGHCDV